MSDRVVIALPSSPLTPGVADVHWWRVGDGELLNSGVGSEWLALALPVTGAPGVPVTALAPLSQCRLVLAESDGTTDRQALAIARATALEQSFASPDTLHAVSAFETVESAGEAEGRRTVTAVVANGVMIEWLDWLSALRVSPASIVPGGLLLPRTDHWRSATVGGDAIVGRGTIVFPYEPALTAAFLGTEEVEEVGTQEIEHRLVTFAQSAPLEMRIGRFARRRLFVLDWARVKELAALAAAIPLLGLIAALVTIVRLNSDSDRLDADSAAVAGQVLGRTVTAASALTELDQRIGQTPGSAGTPFGPISALYQQLQKVPAVDASALGWRRDGTLTATLAAPRSEDLNAVLIPLQGDGYKITAVPRQSPDGRSVADISVRSFQ